MSAMTADTWTTRRSVQRGIIISAEHDPVQPGRLIERAAQQFAPRGDQMINCAIAAPLPGEDSSYQSIGRSRIVWTIRVTSLALPGIRADLGTNITAPGLS